MNGHITAWIEAYHDGELHGNRLRQVEAHLETCSTCRAELEALRGLSTLLQASPAITPRSSAKTFAAQVNLRLPRTTSQPAWHKALKTGWQFAPLGLIAAWAFFQAVALVTGFVLRANLEKFFTPGVTASPGLWQALGSVLSLPGENLLDMVFSVPELGISVALPGGMAYLNILMTLVFAGLLWSWLASWLVYRRRQQSIE
jgi:anti-sigma factor RsiW